MHKDSSNMESSLYYKRNIAQQIMNTQTRSGIYKKMNEFMTQSNTWLIL